MYIWCLAYNLEILYFYSTFVLPKGKKDAFATQEMDGEYSSPTYVESPL